MNNSLHFSIEEPQEKRKRIIATNINVIELLTQQENLVKIREKKDAQLRRLRSNISTAKKNLEEFHAALPKAKHETKQVKEKTTKRNEKEEVLSDDLQKELEQLREKIKSL